MKLESATMNTDYQVLSKQSIEELLAKHNLDLDDFNTQLKSSAFLFNLPNDTFVIYKFREELGLLVFNRPALDKMISEDYFPIDNNSIEREPIEYDKDRIRHINEMNDYYRNLLNYKTGLAYDSITEQVLEEYLLASFKLRKKGKLGEDGVLALTSIVGQFAISKFNGKWALRKAYLGGYNPSFEPYIIKSNQKAIPVYSFVIQFLLGTRPEMDFFMSMMFNVKDAFYSDYFKINNLFLLE